MIRIPKNQIKESKYTSGGEYIIESTNAPYQGYYYELNNVLYAGKVFDLKSPILIPIKNRNTLFNKGISTALFSAISGITSQTLQTPKFNSIPNTIYSPPGDTTPKFYCKKVNEKPTIIKEINEDTYNSLKLNPLYQTTYTGVYNNKNQSIEEANKQMPGITTFLIG